MRLNVCACVHVLHVACAFVHVCICVHARVVYTCVRLFMCAYMCTCVCFVYQMCMFSPTSV